MPDSRRELSPGERFLDFQIVRVLGRGGVGVVYEAIYRTKRQALKLIRSEWVDDPGMVPRMIHEGEILMRIDHPYIVAVHDAGITADHWVWIRMELLDGLNLREAMRRSGPMSLPRVCAFLRTAAHAAHQCHLLGVIHRDIKPENFMVVRDEDGDEVLKLLDFGLAKLYGADTRDLGLIGTPQYMAPEQWNKELAVTPATDLYAIATMAYELYVGHHPLFPDGKADNPWRMMKAHFDLVPPSLAHYGMPAEIAALIQKALAKAPAERPQDAHRWAEDVWRAWRRVRDQHPEIDTYPGEPPLDRIRSRPLLVVAANPAPQWSPPALVAPAPPAPLTHATTQRMVGTPRAPAGATHAGATRDTEPAVGPRRPRPGLTVKLPREERDPSCVAADAPPFTSSAASTGPDHRGSTAPIPPEREVRALAMGSTGTVPIYMESEARPVALGSTGTVPIVWTGAPPSVSALPFRAPSPEPTSAPASAASREVAVPMTAAATAPLEQATSGVRRVDPAEDRAAERPSEPPMSAPGVGTVEVAAGSAPATAGTASVLFDQPRRARPAAPAWRLLRIAVPGVAACLLAAGLWIGSASKDRSGSAPAAPASVEPLAASVLPSPVPAPGTPGAPGAPGTSSSAGATEAPAASEVPAATGAPASSSTTSSSTAPGSSAAPASSALPSSVPVAPVATARPAPAPSTRKPPARPAATATASKAPKPQPSASASAASSGSRLPSNPGQPASTAPATKKPRLPTNPAPKLPAGPAPDPLGGPILD